VTEHPAGGEVASSISPGLELRQTCPIAEGTILVQRTIPVQQNTYRFPRVFGDEFGDKFGEKFSDSLNLVYNVVTNLVMNLVNHHIL